MFVVFIWEQKIQCCIHLWWSSNRQNKFVVVEVVIVVTTGKRGGNNWKRTGRRLLEVAVLQSVNCALCKSYRDMLTYCQVNNLWHFWVSHLSLCTIRKRLKAANKIKFQSHLTLSLVLSWLILFKSKNTKVRFQ